MKTFYVNAGTFQRKLEAATVFDAAVNAVRYFIRHKNMSDERFSLLLPRYIVIHDRGFRASCKDSREYDETIPVELSSEFVCSTLCEGK